MGRGRRQIVEALRVARPLWGAALIVAPGRALGFPQPPSPAVGWVVRALGLRHVAEALLFAEDDAGRPPAWAAPVDVVHAVSMLALAAASSALRREALRSAMAATLLGASAQVIRHESD